MNVIQLPQPDAVMYDYVRDEILLQYGERSIYTDRTTQGVIWVVEDGLIIAHIDCIEAGGNIGFVANDGCAYTDIVTAITNTTAQRTWVDYGGKPEEDR